MTAEKLTHEEADARFPLHTQNMKSRRCFTHKGLEVEERIYLDEKNACYKMCWCLQPFETVMVNSVRNYLFVASFGQKEFGSYGEVSCREAVRNEFEQYWSSLIERNKVQNG